MTRHFTVAYPYYQCFFRLSVDDDDGDGDDDDDVDDGDDDCSLCMSHPMQSPLNDVCHHCN